MLCLTFGLTETLELKKFEGKFFLFFRMKTMILLLLLFKIEILELLEKMTQTVLIFKITSFGQLWCLPSHSRTTQIRRKIGTLLDSFQLFYLIVCKINYLSVTIPSLFMCKKKTIRSFFLLLFSRNHSPVTTTTVQSSIIIYTFLIFVKPFYFSICSHFKNS